MPFPVLVPAAGITIGVGGMFGFTNGGSQWPVISLNFAPDFASVITETLLQPYASEPNHCFIGINNVGLNFEVTVFCIFDTSSFVALPARALICSAEKVQGPFRYLIGTEADFDSESIELFLDRKTKHGSFYLVCGHQPVAPDNPGRISVVPDWKVQLTEIRGRDIHERISDAFGIPLTRPKT